MRHPDPVEADQRYFDDVRVGDAIPAREYGPHTLTSAVFWAAVQENAGLLHFDRDYVRAQRGAKSIVVSGQQRQSYVVRTLLDWTGPRGFLRTMDCRHRASTHEGEMQIYSATVTGRSDDPQSPWIAVDVDGRDQDGQQILTAKCTLLLPLLDWPLDRHVWETATPE
jgi:acyl dehydratase